MKTTIELPDDLAATAKKVAREERTTLRSLVEEGLRHAVERRQRRQPFRWEDLSVTGEGVQPGVEEGNWDPIRDLVYEGRGG